jgi:hypothetical protein
MGFFEYLDAHPVWALVYLIVAGFFAVLAVAIRRDYTATEMLKVMTTMLNNRAGLATPETDPKETKGPRPLNG